MCYWVTAQPETLCSDLTARCLGTNLSGNVDLSVESTLIMNSSVLCLSLKRERINKYIFSIYELQMRSTFPLNVEYGNMCLHECARKT